MSSPSLNLILSRPAAEQEQGFHRGPPPVVPARHRAASSWLVGFVIFQFACQLALLVPALGALRTVVRSAAFGASLSLLLLLRRGHGSRVHPAANAAMAVLAIVALSLLHPTGNRMLARVAQFGLYAAILSPLFWVARAGVDARAFRRTIFIFWAFHTLSAGVGVLQVYVPSLQPAPSVALQARGDDYVESLKITLANGQSVFRPMGLTDMPGGAAVAGLYAMLFGVGLLLSERGWLLRCACLGGMALGSFCLYLAQIRSALMMTAICLVTFCVMLGLRGELRRLGATLLVLTSIVAGGFLWAVSSGGEVVTDRLSTLVAASADDVYYANRGHFLDDTIHVLLPKYPLGAGLGRWGTMNEYFGNNDDPRTQAIWVEIQWTGWLLDGGIPLILAYVAALFVAIGVAWRIAMAPVPAIAVADGFDPGLWAALIVAYNVAAFAMTFNYPLFISQGGLEFWLLNACLFAVYLHSKATRDESSLDCSAHRSGTEVSGG